MKKKLLFALLLMGFTSLVVQVLLIREFLICFYGNELTIGLVLGNWIILEAIGSSVASRFSQINKKPLLSYSLLQCLIALYLPYAIYLIRSLKGFLPLTPGEAMGIIPVFISSLIILSPLSIFDGAQFPIGCRLWKDYSNKNIESVGTVYILEAMGFIIAGPVFTFIFITRFSSFPIAIIIGLLNLISAILLLQKEISFRLKKLLIAMLTAFACIGVALLYPDISRKIDNLSLKKQWKNYELIDSKNSIYGNIAVTKEKEQYTFFNDGIPIITAPVPDIATTEEFVHFAMLTHPAPRDILIVGGGAGGPIFEILKYPIRHIDYAELDPLLIHMIKKYQTSLTQKELNDSRLSVKIADGAFYIKNASNSYDVVFIKLPLPTTLQLNRFYTKEFFESVKNILKNDGMLVFSLNGSLSYLSPELQKLNLSILNTLKETFEFVKVIPGDSNIYLASKNDFSIGADILIQRLKEENIPTRLLTPFHIKDRLNQSWQEWFYNTISKTKHVKLQAMTSFTTWFRKAEPRTVRQELWRTGAWVKNNSTFLPAGLFYSLAYWNMLFSPYLSGFFTVVENIDLKALILIVVLLSILLFLISKFSARFKKLSVSYAMLTSGMLGLTYELLIIFLYQSFYGYVYHHIALLITSFMAGLTLGGWIMMRNSSSAKINFMRLEIGLIIFSLAIIPLFIYLEKTKLNLSFIFFVISAISGFLVGAEFPLANKLYQSKSSTQTAGILYALDLVGSWVGALVTSVVLIPVIGIIQTCLLLAAIKLSSLILITTLKD